MSEGARHGFTLTHLAAVSARLVAHDWTWAHENADMIARNWQRRLAETPAMFDGPVLLSQGCTIRGDTCAAQFFETRFSRFIASRDHGSVEAGVFNAFSAIVPHTADGAILLGEMAAQTANAGRIYFPCGTPDLGDVREGGVVDLAGSAERELLEETGLTVPEAARVGPWVLMRGDGQLAFLRPVHFAVSAEELVGRIERHLAHDDDPELSRMLVARKLSDIDAARMSGFAAAYIEAVLG